MEGVRLFTGLVDPEGRFMGFELPPPPKNCKGFESRPKTTKTDLKFKNPVLHGTCLKLDLPLL